MRSTLHAAPALLPALLCGSLLAGCGTLDDPAVRDTAARFYHAVASKDGAAACKLLAPATLSELEQSSGQQCQQAILAAGVPAVGEPWAVKVYESMAQVRYDGETAFLARFGSQWRVMAAGCTPQSHGLPYDCKVKGA